MGIGPTQNVANALLTVLKTAEPTRTLPPPRPSANIVNLNSPEHHVKLWWKHPPHTVTKLGRKSSARQYRSPFRSQYGQWMQRRLHLWVILYPARTGIAFSVTL